MKSHPPLLLRDALAELFVEASRGDADADAGLRELEAWAGGAKPGPALCRRRAEDGAVLFHQADGLVEPFTSLADWVRDRARRFAAARAWIRADASEGDAVACARAAWDAGLFFEVHELLEPEWLGAEGERRQTLQGLIMAGGALHHLCEANPAGARGLLRKAIDRLDGASDMLGLELVAFARGLGALADDVDHGRVRQIADVRELPRLEESAPTPPTATVE